MRTIKCQNHLQVFIVLSLLLVLPGTAYSSLKCSSLFSHQSQSPQNNSDIDLVFGNLLKDRPDIADSISQQDPKLLKSKPEILGKHFVRENLKKYFPNEPNSTDPVTLYRGVDAETLATDYFGEKSLVWGSQDITDVLPYSLGNSQNLKRVFILKIIIPKYMVYERSGWPVLRYEDVLDLAPFIAKVVVIPVTDRLSRFIDRHPGETNKLINFVEKNYPGLIDETSWRWKPLKSIKQYLEPLNPNS